MHTAYVDSCREGWPIILGEGEDNDLDNSRRGRSVKTLPDYRLHSGGLTFFGILLRKEFSTVRAFAQQLNAYLISRLRPQRG